MVSQQSLKEAIHAAEQAVSDMNDGPLKTAAFNVILSQLLSKANGTETIAERPTKSAAKNSNAAPTRKSQPPQSIKSRILSLRDDTFFQVQRSLAETREELRKHGWHYPQNALSGPMQQLVQDKELRREQVTDGAKKVWKYSNR
jgi:hypothetical protein